MEKVCAVCGHAFQTPRAHQLCCSKTCSHKRELEIVRQWHKDHPERMKRLRENWKLKDPDHARDLGHRWREQHKEKRNADSRKFYATPKGKEARIVHQHNRRRSLAGVKLTRETLEELKSEYAGICPYCNRRIARGHLDHITPVSKGGTNARGNLVWVCAKCNRIKHNNRLLTFLLMTGGSGIG